MAMQEAVGRGPGIAGQRSVARVRKALGSGRGSEQGSRPSAEAEECRLLGWAPPWPQKPLIACWSPHRDVLSSLVKYVPLTYNKVYRYPHLGHRAGLVPALSSMVCIPLAMIIRLGQTEGPFLVVSTRGRPAWGIWAGGRCQASASWQFAM